MEAAVSGCVVCTSAVPGVCGVVDGGGVCNVSSCSSVGGGVTDSGGMILLFLTVELLHVCYQGIPSRVPYFLSYVILQQINFLL